MNEEQRTQKAVKSSDRLRQLTDDLQQEDYDVHAVMESFEGSQAQLLNALIALAARDGMLQQVRTFAEKAGFSKAKQAAENLYKMAGHPLAVLKEESDRLLLLTKQALASDEKLLENKDAIWNLSVHDSKKADLLYPALKARYGLDSPSLYLWDHDIALRQKYSGLMRQDASQPGWTGRMKPLLSSIEDMVFIEENLLYPMAALSFQDSEWQEMYYNLQDYPACFGLEAKKWSEGEEWHLPDLPDPEQAVVLQGGVMTVRELNAMLNALPLEITFVDADSTNAYFNIGHKAFKRPTLSLNHEVFDCHPHQVSEMVREMIENFTTGKKDAVHIWMMKHDEPYYVTYMALRDTAGKYLGTLEVIQPMEFAKEHFRAAGDFQKKMTPAN